jgi:hypothetical protein
MFYIVRRGQRMPILPSNPVNVAELSWLFQQTAPFADRSTLTPSASFIPFSLLPSSAVHLAPAQAFLPSSKFHTLTVVCTRTAGCSGGLPPEQPGRRCVRPVMAGQR